MLSRDSEQADTADHVYRGLIRVRLIFSEKSASLGVQCQKCYGAKVTPHRKGDQFWATTHTYLTFVTWLYTKSSRWTRISRSRCQATNTSGNDVNSEATEHEFWNAVTWFWTSRHRWPRILRSHSRVIDIFREIGFPWCPVPKMLCSKSHPRKKGRSILRDHAHFSYLCHVTIYKVQPLNKNIAVSLPATNTSGNDVNSEVTAHEFLNAVTWFWTSRHSWPRISRSYSRAIDIFREIGFPWCPVPKMLWSKSHPPQKGRSILSDHAHLSYLCHVTIHKVEPLNKNIAVSLPGNQYFRKWRKLGSDRARILKCCHVILNKQTPLTTYIAVSFACDWYFPRNRLPLVSSAKNAM